MNSIDRCYIEITNVCNLNCHFCPKHTRAKRQLTLQEFDTLTERIRGRVVFLYFHLMGEPMLHPLLPDFIRMAREKGFRTVLTSNGTLMQRAPELLLSLPHKIQLSLHSHESNGKGILKEYIDEVMQFAMPAAEQDTCVVLRLWNQGGMESENAEVMRLLATYVPQPWHERPDGFRLCTNLYLEFDRKFQWPDAKNNEDENETLRYENENENEDEDENEDANPNNQTAKQRNNETTKQRNNETTNQYFCKALRKQIGVLADGRLVPCCLDHNGDVVLGNLLEQSLDDILSSPRAQALIEGFHRHAAVEPLCQSCESALLNNSFRGKARKQ